MRIKVVLRQATLDLIWARSYPDRRWNPQAISLQEDDVIVELDDDVLSESIDLFDDDTFDDAIRRLAHSRWLATADSGAGTAHSCCHCGKPCNCESAVVCDDGTIDYCIGCGLGCGCEDDEDGSQPGEPMP